MENFRVVRLAVIPFVAGLLLGVVGCESDPEAETSTASQALQSPGATSDEATVAGAPAGETEELQASSQVKALACNVWGQSCVTTANCCPNMGLRCLTTNSGYKACCRKLDSLGFCD